MVSRFSLRRFESSLQVTHAVLTINPCLPQPPLEGEETLTEVDDHFAARFGAPQNLDASVNARPVRLPEETAHVVVTARTVQTVEGD
jgi:hypothetical protein